MADRKRSAGLRPDIAQISQVNFRTAGAAPYLAVAKEFSDAANRADQRLDDRAIEKGKEAGKQAGNVGEFDKKDGSTLFGSAFNQAASASYMDRTETNARIKMAGLKAEFADNPKGFKGAADGYIAGVVGTAKDVDKPFADSLRRGWELMQSSALPSIVKAHSDRFADERKAEILQLRQSIYGTVDQSRDELFSGSETAAGVWVGSSFAGWERMRLSLSGERPDGEPLFSKSEIEKERQLYFRNMYVQAFKGWVDAQEDKTAALEQLQDGTAAFRFAEVGDDGEIAGSREISLTGALPTTGGRTFQLEASDVNKIVGHLDARVTVAHRFVSEGLRKTEEQLANLEIAVVKGDKGIEDIERLNDEGFFDGRQQKRASLTRLVLTRNEKAREAEVKIGRVYAAINSDEVQLDATDKDDKDAADAAFIRMTAGTRAALDDPNEVEVALSTMTTEFARTTGLLPKSAQASITSALRAGTVEQKIVAADQVSRLDELGNNALRDMSKEDIALGLTISSMVRAGRDPELAVEAALMATDTTNRPLIEARTKVRKDEKLAEDYGGWLDDHFNPTSVLDFLPFGPDDDGKIEALDGTRARVTEDFRVLFEDWHNRTGDKDVARKQALAELSRVWGVSSINGEDDPRVMKYAPEAFYGIGDGDDVWMRKQLDKQVKEAVPTLGAANLLLGTDTQTAREASAGRPSYPVMTMTTSGIFVQVEDANGKVVRWRPNSKDVKGQREADALTKAKERRRVRVGVERFIDPRFFAK